MGPPFAVFWGGCGGGGYDALVDWRGGLETMHGEFLFFGGLPDCALLKKNLEIGGRGYCGGRGPLGPHWLPKGQDTDLAAPKKNFRGPL